MRLKKQILLLYTLLLLSFSSIAGIHSEPDNSSAVDSIKMNHYFPNHLLLTDSVVNFGKIFLNTPYHFGSPGISSFDCSGFTSHVYRNFGYNLGRSSVDQSKQFDTIDRNQLKTGDLVFFSGRRRSKHVGHVGIVVSAKENGEFEFIHSAVHSGVIISNSKEEYYMKRFVKASRVIGSNIMLSISKLMTKSEKPTKETLTLTSVSAPVQTIKKIIPAEYHQVKSGETLSSISKKYGITIAELKQKNNIKRNKLSLKQSLKVKDEETDMVLMDVHSSVNNQILLADNSTSRITEYSKAEQNLATNQTNNSHLVKKGETLFSISNLYNISIEELKNINKIIKERIHPGQKLKISHPVDETKIEQLAKVEEAPKPAIHKVIKGETLFSISKTKNISVDELKRINNITSSNIHKGQELKLILDNEIKTQTLVVEKSDKKQDSKIENNEKMITHKIRKGENLGSIAKNNNTTVDELKRINNLPDSKIHLGQELLIQDNGFINKNLVVAKNDKKQDIKTENKENSTSYKIKKGESLISIARDNNISLDELKRINNITNSKIKSGQDLKISQSLEKPKQNTSRSYNDTKNIQHKVKSGESFYTIAKIYGCTIEELKDWNKKTGSKIKIGEIIIILLRANT